MTIADIVRILQADLVCGADHLETEVHNACGSDMMSDVLAFVKDQSVLLTGLVNPQVVRTGFENGYYERGTAIGLFKSVINFVLLLSANAVVKKINGYGMYEVAES